MRSALTGWVVAALLMPSIAAASAAASLPIGVELAGRPGNAEAVRLHVTIDGDSARAVLHLGRRGRPINLQGSATAESGSLSYELDLEADRKRDRLTGSIDFRRGRFEGRWTAGRKEEPLDLVVIAERVTRVWTRGPRLSSKLAFPSFRPPVPNAAELTSLIGDRLEARQADFFRDGVAALADTTAAPSFWQQSIAGSLVHWSADWVSLLASDWHFTGGAHGNTDWFGLNFILGGESGAVRRVGLADLFRDGEGWQPWISKLVLRELDKQGASSVTAGSISHLDADALSVWGLGPDGLTFVFPAYSVGSYAEGVYRVTIPLHRLEEHAAPRGPISRMTHD